MDALVGPSPLAFLAASVLIILAPGPDMTLVARNTIARGRMSGLRTAAGALMGVSVHVLAAVAGLSAILTGSAVAFSAVKLAGAAYLLLLGARTLLASRLTARGDAADDVFAESAPRLITATASPELQGVLSAVLNPKLAVFFLTFLPQFVYRDDLAELSMLAHGAVFVLMASAWLTVWVLTLDRLSLILRRSAVRAWMERATGAVLVAMGLRLAFAHR
ncbi:MAG: LysE family translocator [Chloroflexi bacterium]|nr:LysE family translocator [Chloroflexota bacterium]